MLLNSEKVLTLQNCLPTLELAQISRINMGSEAHIQTKFLELHWTNKREKSHVKP